MPILPEEPSIHPEDLLTLSRTNLGAEEELENPRRWWILHTRPRQEKAVARQLFAWEVPYYLPLVPQTKIRQGRRRVSYLPVFDGYICLFGNDAERVDALKTNRILQVMPVDDQAQLIDELSNLQRLIQVDAPLTIERNLEVGRRVRVKKGVMEGLEGIIIERRGEDRLLVAATCIGQGISISIEDFMVEPA